MSDIRKYEIELTSGKKLVMKEFTTETVVLATKLAQNEESGQIGVVKHLITSCLESIDGQPINKAVFSVEKEFHMGEFMQIQKWFEHVGKQLGVGEMPKIKPLT